MLTKRIIACLDVRNDGSVVKGINFVDFKNAGDPVTLATSYYRDGVDELVFLDVNTNENKRPFMIDVIKKVASQIYIPFTVGGGIKTLIDIKNVLLAGADKVSLNKRAISSPELITQAANMFGSQAIVVAIDAKRIGDSWNAYVSGGKVDTGKDAIEWAKEAVRRGAGEILLTSIDRDGTKKGFDIELTRRISQQVPIPVIASGGAGRKEDFYEVFTRGKCDAALAASLFHFNTLSIIDLKKYLIMLQIPIRI